ncbi:malonyl-CoA synthase [uncultured Cocleimonas sp.]|uniref:malonate--CoA ligase n=1 Tax=uncultured Cocleimonas sp. TaxID=1051587 RepID=UPI0026255C63|nr:malonyl-CoA synthase [uncultured Cocleimonas sp.]
MYDSNFLLNQLRQASIGSEQTIFAKLDDDSNVTYGELFSNAEKIASMLVKNGLKPDDRVLVQVNKSIQAVQLYLGTMLAGGIFLPLNTAYTSEEISYFISDATPAILICDPKKLNTLEPLAEKSGVIKTFTLDQAGNGSLMDAANKETEGFTGVPRTENDLASIIYTSGTTGRSKGAMLSGLNLISNASTLMDYWKFDNKDVLIHSLPIFHVHGLFVAINITLLAGSKLIFHHNFDVDTILSDMNSASVLMGVPTFYVRLLQTEGLNKTSTINMRLFVSGSAPMLEETHKQWQEKTGHSIIERYGMSETNMNTSNPYDGERKAGTVGLPLPNTEVIVADPESGKPLNPGEVGSVEIRGPNVFSGYWNMPEKTAEEIRENGFFITGDLGVFGEDGYLSIVGRSKDLVISGGYNIYPKELELLIDDIEGVNESAVIGLPDKDFGEKIAAVIVKDNSSEISENVIFKELESKLARFKQPRHIIFVDELPRNTMGKVQKNSLRETYQNL